MCTSLSFAAQGFKSDQEAFVAALDQARHPRLVEARAGADLAGAPEVDHQHPHRTVGLGLQDEAAVKLQ